MILIKKVNFKIKPRSVNYTIRYDANGGSGKAMANSVISEGKSIRANTYRKEGYTFSGWSLEPNGEVVYLNKSIFSTASEYGTQVILYAQWERQA